jgi:hypothetical protein
MATRAEETTMGDQEQLGRSVVENPVRSGWSTTVWGLLAVLGHVALLDAAVETFVSGTPARWWLSTGLFVLATLSAWVCRPAGRLFGRFGPVAAAWTPVLIFLAALACTAWWPGGQESGIRVFLQPTSRVLTGTLALGVLVSSWVLVRDVTFLPATLRLVVRALVVLLGLYALAALVIGIRDHTSFAPLFNGGAVWQRAPRWLQGTAVAAFVLFPLGVVVALVSSIQKRGVAGLRQSGLWTPTALLLALAIALAGYRPPTSGNALAIARSGSRPPAGGVAITPDAPQDTRAAETLRVAALAGKTDAAGAADRVRYLLEQFASLQAQVPRETFDAKTVIAAVGNEPASLFAWIRDNTSWAPYRGSLRGPVGVLMDRIGNSLDRSLLLADLLRRTGRKARLAHAQLAPDQARALLARTRAIPPIEARQPQEPANWERQQEEVLMGYAARFSPSPDAFFEAAQAARRAVMSDIASARRSAHDQAAVLASSIRGEVPRGRSEDEESLAAASDHWWVQYQQDGSWVNLDPSPSDAAPDQSVAAIPASVSDNVPPGSGWTLTMNVVVEAWSEGRLRERRVLTHRVPVSDAAWQDITLAHIPLGFPDPAGMGTDAAAWRSAALRVQEWIPVLMVGKKRISQGSFRDDGTVNDRPGKSGGSLASPGGLFGALGGGEKPESTTGGILTAEWVDYELKGPGSAPRRFRRTWFDLVGPKARATAPAAAPAMTDAVRAERALSLLGETAVQVQVCRPSSPFLADRMLQRFSDNRTALLALLPGAGSRKAPKSARTLLSKLAPASNALWGWASERFDASEVGGEVFVGAPGIATLRSEVVAEPGQAVRGRGVFDIVTNTVSVASGARSSSFRTRIEQGVADTLTEGRGLRAGNTSEVFRRAAEQAITTRVIASREKGWSRPQGVSEDVLARIDADVSSGHHVLLPERPVTVAGSPRLGWWRVEAASGTTVGVMDSGYHQGLSEYLPTQEEATVIITFIVSDFVWEHTGPERKAFCTILGGLMLAAGAALMSNEGYNVEVSVGK